MVEMLCGYFFKSFFGNETFILHQIQALIDFKKEKAYIKSLMNVEILIKAG